MKKKIILLLLSVTVIAGIFFVGCRFEKRLSKYAALLEKVESIESYVDAYAIMPFDDEAALDNAVEAYYATLDDKYSEYFSASDYDTFIESLHGNFTGVGIQIYATADPIVDGLFVYQVLGNSPAEAAGIMPCDVIIAVNGDSIIDLAYDTVINMIIGEPGTFVELTVLRDGKEMDISVQRDSFVQRAVDYRILDGEIGYVQIHNFNTNALIEFTTAINSLISDNVQGFIFDLRNNPGGELETVVDMVDLLAESDEIVIIERKYSQNVYSSQDGVEIDKPMVVLVNGSSASASELFASALRDIKQVPLVGEQTRGKGVGQQTFTLSDGSALKMTTFRYYTKSRTDYNDIGLVPDVEVIMSADDLQIFYSLDETNDEQLRVAIDELNMMIKNTK